MVLYYRLTADMLQAVNVSINCSNISACGCGEILPPPPPPSPPPPSQNRISEYIPPDPPAQNTSLKEDVTQVLSSVSPRGIYIVCSVLGVYI